MKRRSSSSRSGWLRRTAGSSCRLLQPCSPRNFAAVDEGTASGRIPALLVPAVQLHEPDALDRGRVGWPPRRSDRAGARSPLPHAGEDRGSEGREPSRRSSAEHLLGARAPRRSRAGARLPPKSHRIPPAPSLPPTPPPRLTLSPHALYCLTRCVAGRRVHRVMRIGAGNRVFSAGLLGGVGPVTVLASSVSLRVLGLLLVVVVLLISGGGPPI